jgi:hypothetical protein
MQMSLSGSAAQDGGGGLVKGPYMVSNGGNSYYNASPTGNESSYQAQQVQIHQAVTNATFDMAAMYQPMQQQYQSPYTLQQNANTSSSAVPYAAHNLSVPSYYRIHSADPVVAQENVTGAVKMESVSPRASISVPLSKSIDVDELETSGVVTLKQRDSIASSGATSKVSTFPSSTSSGPDSAPQSVNGDVDLSKVILNPLGGGRGYVPGETPDDPKKRHKCDVCGRSFARLFNLKVSLFCSVPWLLGGYMIAEPLFFFFFILYSQSHQQTHDPLRLKPHVCPHETCARSFSRLHDLERHRQGVSLYIYIFGMNLNSFQHTFLISPPEPTGPLRWPLDGRQKTRYLSLHRTSSISTRETSRARCSRLRPPLLPLQDKSRDHVDRALTYTQ